ncbi:NO-inducible flavohemoprotein [bacterium]|nr:NO-inducible flavohemoprotein [bacterium]
MLSDRTVALVKSTAPLLEEHGEELTRHFYNRMFRNNPEVQPLFNPANQVAGNQQRALAAAITGYAANIDNLEVLGGAVELIAQKHASLLIEPEHYPIVGQNLLASIREVLGESATEEVLSAWGEAYGFLAEILIGRERQIYQDNARKPGGWSGFKPFKVVRKQPESSNITSFYLSPSDGAPLPEFKPGQYVTVRATRPDGLTTMRNYSLSDRPGQEYFRISVKRESSLRPGGPDGFVSKFLHDEVEVGAQVELGPPCGEFFLDISEKHARPLVLLAAGVGITPIMSMLLTALEAMPDREIVFVHGILNEKVHAFRATVEELRAKHPALKVHFRYSDPAPSGVSREGLVSTGLIDATLIESLVSGRDADYYFCGPQPFMVGIYHELLRWGIPPNQVHFEFFGPRQALVH